MRSIVASIAFFGIACTAPGCTKECFDADPRVLLEIVVEEGSTTSALEVTLEFDAHRFRRRYPIADQLADGRTTIEVALEPPPAKATELRVGVRSFGADEAPTAERSMVATIRPDACNELTIDLGAAECEDDSCVPADAGVGDGSIRDAGDDACEGGACDAGDAALGECGAECANEDAGIDAAIEDCDAAACGNVDAAIEDASIADAGFDDASMPDGGAFDAGPPAPVFREVTIDNGGGPARSSYVVRVEFDSAQPIAEGKMRADGADLRVFADDRTTPLDHWIESGIGTASTVLWVEVPSLPENGIAAIYLWYGDPNASSASDGAATFLFFADFDAAPIGDDGSQEGITPLSGIWSVVAGGYRGNGYQEVGTPGRMSVSAGGSFTDVALSVRVRLPATVSGGVNGLYLRMGDLDNTYFFGPFQQNAMTFGKYGAGTYSAIAEVVVAVQREVWHDVTITAEGTSFRGYLDGALVVSASDASFASGGIGLRTWGTNVRYDDLRVRPFRSPEPVTTVGPEE